MAQIHLDKTTGHISAMHNRTEFMCMSVFRYDFNRLEIVDALKMRVFLHYSWARL